MFIELGQFIMDSDVEEVLLNGNYDFMEVKNPADVSADIDRNINCQSVYRQGNIVYRTDTENIKELIQLFIRYTSDSCKDLEAEFDFSVKSTKQMIGGTIRPTKKVLFAYKNKIIVAYGRYIFGYDKTYVKFKREDFTENEDSLLSDVSDDIEGYSDEDLSFPKSLNERIRHNEITNDKIILEVPKPEKHLDDYVYSFMIYDQGNGVLDAFGLYR